MGRMTRGLSFLRVRPERPALRTYPPFGPPPQPLRDFFTFVRAPAKTRIRSENGYFYDTPLSASARAVHRPTASRSVARPVRCPTVVAVRCSTGGAVGCQTAVRCQTRGPSPDRRYFFFAAAAASFAALSLPRRREA